MTAPATARAVPHGMREIELSIEGMTCAACAARVEKKLNKLQDVAAAVNYATATARVIAPAGLPVQELTAAVEQAGYAASEPTAARAGEGTEAADGRDAAYLKRRLIVALVFFIPLTDLSLMLSLVPSLRFAGWQWLLVACAAPVALWCAWPFHRAALKNARHGTSSMDTLVSLGIIAACGWSVYAMFVLDPAEHGGSFWQLLIHASGGGIYLETAATVTTFLLAGRLYEARARRIAGQAMRELAAAGASDVCLLGPDGTERLVPAGSLRPGDRFVVRPGEIIAADGEVLFGQTAVDRSHDDRGVGAGRGGRGRQRHRRHRGAHRAAGRPRGQDRPGHSAVAPDQAGRAALRHRRRPSSGWRTGSAACSSPRCWPARRRHSGGLAAGRLPRRARGSAPGSPY